MAREWPENLGVGKPYDTDERIEDYLENLYWEKKGKSSKADELGNKIIDQTLHNDSFTASTFLGAMLLKNTGKTDEAKTIIQNWNKKEPENPVAAWSYETLFGSTEKAAALLNEIKEKSGESLLNPEEHNNDFGLLLAVFEVLNE